MSRTKTPTNEELLAWAAANGIIIEKLPEDLTAAEVKSLAAEHKRQTQMAEERATQATDPAVPEVAPAPAPTPAPGWLGKQPADMNAEELATAKEQLVARHAALVAQVQRIEAAVVNLDHQVTLRYSMPWPPDQSIPAYPALTLADLGG